MRVNLSFSNVGRVLGGMAWLVGAGMLGSCGEKKPEAVSAAPSGEAVKAPVPEATVAAMKEPEAPVVTAAAAVPPAAAAAGGGAVVVKARFEGYQAQAARSLWQPVMLGEAAVQYALLSPLEPVSTESGLVVAGGAENLALGLEGGALRTAEGKPLGAGQVYEFRFSRATGAAVWTVEVSPATP
jgi:hypothetical protein